MKSQVYFASARVARLEAAATLPAKFERLLSEFPLSDMVKGKNVVLKMHVGGNIGYTTIHPVFVKVLVQALKNAGANVFAADNSISGATGRGYTPEVLGIPFLATAGPQEKYYYRRPVEYRTMKEIQVAGNIADAEAMINFAHGKGHGDCGFGGCIKNIAMGCVTGKTRSDLHQLEGGMTWDEEKCTHCNLCVEACRYDAARFDENNRFTIFYHHCTYCRHCVNVCPEKAITIDPSGFIPFQEGMAISTREVLATFEPSRVLHIIVLTNITALCDCWGFSTPSLVPDIGIMASTDIVAAETAALDAIKVENLIPGNIPGTMDLGEGKHLFEKLYGKNPYIQVQTLEKFGLGSAVYELVEVR